MENSKEKLIEAAKLIREHCDHSPNCEGCPFMEDWVGICGVKNAYPSGWYIEGDKVDDADN